MSLSDYEKIQFERLTEDLMFDDSSSLEKMRKIDESLPLKRNVKKDITTTIMSRLTLPTLSTVCAVLAFIAMIIAVGSVMTSNGAPAVIAALSGLFLCGGGALSLEQEKRMAYHKTRTAE
jgi:hypothetical protein